MISNEMRPITFDEVKGQDMIVQNIRNQSIHDSFFPVFVLCGQYGSGKTTMAELIARAANCEHKDENGNPCGKCAACLAVTQKAPEGIIEIDGASNNGVDNIRSLIGQANTLSYFKKKVIVIDEAHMLSKSAFNALLITLENPPEHCIFILCTTDKSALPATVLSRATVATYNFGKIADDVIRDQILHAAGKYGIGITADAAGLIARYSHGAMRNALQLLEHLSMQNSGKEIQDSDVVSVLGISSIEERSGFLKACMDMDVPSIINILHKCEKKGFALKNFLSDILRMNTDVLLCASGAEVVGSQFYLQNLKELASYGLERVVSMSQILSPVARVSSTELSVERIIVEVLGATKRMFAEDSPMQPPKMIYSGARKEMSAPAPEKSEKSEEEPKIQKGFVAVGEDRIPFAQEEESEEPLDLFSDFNFIFNNGTPKKKGRSKKTSIEENSLLEPQTACPSSAGVSCEEPVQEVEQAVEQAVSGPCPFDEIPEIGRSENRTEFEQCEPENAGGMSWADMAALGLVNQDIHLPKPETEEEIEQMYKAEEEAKRQEEEAREALRPASHSDYMKAEAALERHLGDAAFKLIYNKARVIEKDNQIYLLFKKQPLVAAAKLCLIGEKNIIVDLDREE